MPPRASVPRHPLPEAGPANPVVPESGTRGINQFRCIARIVERDALRFTPAGIPVVSLRLRHESEQWEAGMPRRIDMEIAAIAVGEISGAVAEASLEDDYAFCGFIARKSRHGKSLVFHLTGCEAYQENPLSQEPNHGIR